MGKFGGLSRNEKSKPNKYVIESDHFLKIMVHNIDNVFTL